VLGGTGWVGRYLCADLHRHGHRVTVVARRPAPHVAGHRFVAADLADLPTAGLAAVLRRSGADTVVNATDAANAGDGFDPPARLLAAVNVELVRRLVDVAGARGCRLVHIGTLHEHGVDPGVDPGPDPGWYAHTKAAGSRVVLDATAAAAVEGRVLRCANVCGPHPSPATFPGKLLTLLTSAAETGEPVRIPVSPTRRDYVDVRDVARALRLASTASGPVPALDVGSGEAVDARTVVTTMVRAAGLPAHLVRLHGDDVPTLGGDVTRARIGPAAEALGWRPRIGLATSLSDMWQEGARRIVRQSRRTPR
jgi:nucleoside-diphosphate-sugar epimerase